jgi:glycosyltransferase involved in cell wall biosynthesis
MNGKADSCTPGWLFVLPWSIRYVSGGVNQVVTSLILEFRKGGIFDPHLITSTEGSETRCTREPDVIEPFHLDLWSPIDHDHPFRAWISFLYRLPYRCWELWKITHRYNIRVINPHYPGLASLVFLILKKTGLFKGKIILSFHLSDIQGALATNGVERKLWRILLRGADHSVVVSRDSAANLLKLDSSIADKLVTIPNGVDLALFPLRDRGVTAGYSGFPQERTIVSVGAFLPRKGHDVLIRAFRYVLELVPDARLIIVGGDGPEVDPLRSLINSLALNDKIRICKDVPHEQIPTLLCQAQLFVLASRQEGHPLAVVEAGAAGLPIVCTQGAWSRELISDGVTGRLVPLGDERALASAMVDLLIHPREAQRMASRFHDYVKKNLGFENTYRKYLQLDREHVSCEHSVGVS